MKAMEILNSYIKDLTITGNLSKQNLEDAKQEQKKIISEVKNIKHSLDSLINDIGYIGNTLNEKK
jgi:predicted translin family RNA/ssDNA-binding protein